VARSWLRALAPPPIIAPSVFAEREIVLPGSANAIPGPLRLAPYQHELVDAIAADDVEIIVLMLSSQTGKSISIDSMVGYCIACAPGPMLHVSPTGARSEEFVRDRFDPLVAASPTLRGLVGTGQDTRKGSTGGANSLSSKSFPGGQLNFASSFKPDELAARAIRWLFLDEIDRFTLSAGIEGDPIRLAIKRTTTFKGRGRKVVLVSTPTSRTASRINAWYLRGDQRKFVVPCPDCGSIPEPDKAMTTTAVFTAKAETVWLGETAGKIRSRHKLSPIISTRKPVFGFDHNALPWPIRQGYRIKLRRTGEVFEVTDVQCDSVARLIVSVVQLGRQKEEPLIQPVNEWKHDPIILNAKIGRQREDR
jgi:phage terminase large subunit GpA-like protein